MSKSATTSIPIDLRSNNETFSSEWWYSGIMFNPMNKNSDFLTTPKLLRGFVGSSRGLSYVIPVTLMCICALLYGDLIQAQPPRPGGGPPGGPGGGNQNREIVDQFDKDKNGRLNAEERAEALEFLKESTRPRWTTRIGRPWWSRRSQTSRPQRRRWRRKTYPKSRGGNYDGPRGIELEPLAGLSDPSKPIIMRLLSVESLQKKYLGYVREIAENSLDWKKVGPWVTQYKELIQDDVKKGTRNLYSTEAFLNGTADEPMPGNLISFFDQRRAFLLNHSDLKQ